MGTKRNYSLLVLCAATLVVACTPTREHGPGAASVAATPVTVKLIAFNDFHGQLTPPGGPTRVADPDSAGPGTLDLPTGGVASLAGLVRQLKAQNPLNAVVAAGDLIGASPLSSALFHDEPSIEALSALGLEFSSVGNHEFDDGIAELRRMQNGGCFPGGKDDTCRRGAFAGASFKYLAANVLDATTGKTIFPAYAVKALPLAGGRVVKIGFIGAVLKGVPDIVVPSGVRNLTFTDEATAVNAAVPALRAQGVSAIVLLIHEGGTISASAFDDTTCADFKGGILPIMDRLDPAVDVVVSAHTHRTYICRRNGRLVTSAGSQGRFVTDIELSIDPQLRRVISTSASEIAVVNDSAPNPAAPRYPTVAKDGQVQAIADFYSAAAAPLTERVVARIDADISHQAATTGESPLGDLIADAQLAATSAAADGGAQIALMNLEGIRANLYARNGRITYGEVYAVHPFGNALVTLSLTGAQLHALLEEQWQGGNAVLQGSAGFTYEWKAAAPAGSRVDPKSIRLNGVIVDPLARYRVTVNEFLASGGDGFKVLIDGTERLRGIPDVDALEKYLAAHSPVTAPAMGRIRRL